MYTINKRYRNRSQNIVISHFQANLREYTIFSIIFLIGILFGIVFVNNLDNEQINEITEYITNSIINVKQNFNKYDILKNSIKNHIIIVTLLWLMGSTVIGLLLVYFIILFKGFGFGYTISSIISVLGTSKGIIFTVSTMFFKNIIVIPCIIALAVSGMKLNKSIIHNGKNENLKLAIIKHTIFSVFILLLLITTSCIEVHISQSMLNLFIKYI